MQRVDLRLASLEQQPPKLPQKNRLLKVGDCIYAKRLLFFDTPN